MDDEDILNNINDNSIIKYIKKVYPKIIYEKINIKNNDRDILGFIIKDKQLIIGFIDKDGILNKIMDPIKLSTSNENLENIFKKIPIVESFTEQDKENLIKMIENNDSDISLKEVILKKDKLIKELENKNNNYNVLFDENKKEMLIYKKEYEDKVKEIKKEYDEKIAVEISNYTKNINNCKDKLINEKKEIINAIIEYKKNIENHIKNILNNNIGIEEIKKIKESYNKLLKEKNEIERNLEIILKSEEKNKALVEDELKRKELEYKREIEKEKEKYNQEKEENERKYREEIEKIKKECIDSKDSILKETLTKTQNEYIVEIENLKDECKKRLLEKENIHIENVKKIKDEENMSKEMIKMELKEMERKYQEELKKEKELYKQDLDKREKEFIIKIDEMKKVYEQGEKSINEKNYIEEIDKIKNLFLQKENNIKETLLKKENEYIKEKERIKAEYDEIIIKKEEEYKEGHIKDLEIKENKIKELEKVINTIKEELSTIEKKFSKTEVERLYFENFNKKCIEKILNEKEIIIQNIKRYREEWIDWIKNNNIDIDKNKIKLKNELDIIFNTLKKIKMERDVYINNLNISSKEKSQIIAKLQNNMEEMKIELKKTLSDQIIKLTKINEELTNKLREKDIELNRKNDEISKYKLELEEVKKYIDKNQESVTKCNKELQIVKEMLDKNILQLKNKQTSKVDYNYNECEIILNNFININNIFYRKLEIIKILDGIINYNGINSFTNLNENIKQKIIQKFNKTKSEILNYINNMKLHKYIETPYLNYFKNKNMINKIPIEFCEDLKELLNYWLKEEENFRINDIELTNIYEDLSGSVRVYVRIKPLIGEKNKTVFVDKNKVTIDCSELMLNRKETFGDFYGVYDGVYTNKDIYRGYIETGLIDQYNLIVDIDKNVKSNGLYNVFQQVENGYSIVIFGYGLSGSGKTFTLIGQNNIPGILHYGLANLRNVKTVKLKYLFEQYIDTSNIGFVPTINKIRGNIINLINEIPQLRKYNINENAEFLNDFPKDVNINNLKIIDLNKITNYLEKYRISKKRIKVTPNNPVSSRSHLYMIYEILFETGIVGYITIVDTAGRESPINIYDEYIDKSKKISLTTILGPTGGIKVLEKAIKEEYKNYDINNVYNTLKEGFYINETINHLIYYFNKKNYKSTKIIKQINLDKYSEDKYYVSPIEEENSINDSNNCLMIPILKFLDVLSNKKKDEEDYKPTKFITIVCVRKDEKYCDQIFSSLEFAQKIRSS